MSLIEPEINRLKELLETNSGGDTNILKMRIRLLEGAKNKPLFIKSRRVVQEEKLLEDLQEVLL